MTAQPAEPPAPQPHESPAQAVAGWFRRGEADAAGAARRLAEAGVIIRDHAGTVFAAASAVIDVLRFIDPADAAALSAAETCLERVLAMTESASKAARAAGPAPTGMPG